VRLVFLFALVAGIARRDSCTRLSAQFIGRSIESWFDVRVDRALDSGLTLADSSLKYLLNDTSNKATQLALGYPTRRATCRWR
jgi:nitrogen fixation/metabolism regulation signal transduction histidine kinase